MNIAVSQRPDLGSDTNTKLRLKSRLGKAGAGWDLARFKHLTCLEKLELLVSTLYLWMKQMLQAIEQKGCFPQNTHDRTTAYHNHLSLAKVAVVEAQ